VKLKCKYAWLQLCSVLHLIVGWGLCLEDYKYGSVSFFFNAPVKKDDGFAHVEKLFPQMP